MIFPNGKKTKAATGAKLKDVAAKAGYKPNYGCEVRTSSLQFYLPYFSTLPFLSSCDIFTQEGKCGSCEIKLNGKKIRPCTAKVPNAASPIKFENA